MNMNIQFTENPYNGVDVISRGVTVDAKVAKLNNTTKRPVLVANWEKNMPKVTLEPTVSKEEPKDYSSLLGNLDMTVVNHAKEANNSGAKKLRVNKIVNEKTSKVYESSEKVSLTPQEEVVNLINQISVTPAPVEAKEEVKEEVHGRHEKTGEVPVNDIRDAIRQELTGTIPVVSSRMEKNAPTHEVETKEEMPKEEVKAGDMDLYNDLLHSGKAIDDVSRQLQGAREELTIEKEESRKLAEQYGKAVRELEELKEDIENKKRIKAQQEKRELTETLNNIKTLKEENLARTSDLSSIQAEIAKLKAEKEAMESTMYSDRSFGRRAA